MINNKEIILGVTINAIPDRSPESFGLNREWVHVKSTVLNLVDEKGNPIQTGWVMFFVKKEMMGIK